MTRPVLAIALMAGISAANAQETVSHTWIFTEVIAGTQTPVSLPNGVIEPGESARISLSVTLTPGIGAPLTYTPPPAPGSGTLAGLGSIYFDLVGTGIQGSWILIARDSAFVLGGAGFADPSGAVIGAQAGQFLQPGESANSSNPVADIWHGVWTPSTYTPHTAAFHSQHAEPRFPSNSTVLIQYGTDPTTGAPEYVGLTAADHHSGLSIPVVPAPPLLPAIATIALLAPVRRRPQS